VEGVETMIVLPGSKVKVLLESPKLNILKCWNLKRWNEVELTATASVPPRSNMKRGSDESGAAVSIP